MTSRLSSMTSGLSFWPSICLPSQICIVGLLSTRAVLSCATRSRFCICARPTFHARSTPRRRSVRSESPSSAAISSFVAPQRASFRTWVSSGDGSFSGRVVTVSRETVLLDRARLCHRVSIRASSSFAASR